MFSTILFLNELVRRDMSGKVSINFSLIRSVGKPLFVVVLEAYVVVQIVK